MKAVFTDTFTALQRSIINRLAEIEKADADACAGCGGEDCVCCEIWHDRQKWVSPEELFEEDDYYGCRGHRESECCAKCGEYLDEWCDEWGLCQYCCTCE